MIDASHAPTPPPPATPPPIGTRQRWAYDYVCSDDLAYKLAPPPLPENAWTHTWIDATPLRLSQPGRPPELKVTWDKVKTPRPGALVDPNKRAELLHTFLHHELQAAELMCWAVLAFPDTPVAFHRGLLGICHDEIRHCGLYAAHIERLGHHVGDFPVRDWFWSRVPSAQTPLSFVATMGLGFEAGNLDHAHRFADRFEAVGDTEGAQAQRLVAHEEIAHVAFAAHWFRHWYGELSFEAWRAALPEPLSPMVMRGLPVNRDARLAASFDAAFVDALSQWQPE